MKESCLHYYDNGKGAVEPIGFEDKTLEGKIKGIILDKEDRGYCKICGKLTKANIPLEECVWYKKALIRYKVIGVDKKPTEEEIKAFNYINSLDELNNKLRKIETNIRRLNRNYVKVDLEIQRNIAKEIAKEIDNIRILIKEMNVE